MPYEGDLVKLLDGSWARFERCRVRSQGAEAGTMLVAVELDERYQGLLAKAEASLESYRSRGIPVRMRLDADDEQVHFASIG
jgi:hypothetical protein